MFGGQDLPLLQLSPPVIFTQKFSADPFALSYLAPVCNNAFCLGHPLLRGCLWDANSHLWGTANVITQRLLHFCLGTYVNNCQALTRSRNLTSYFYLRI